MSQNDFSIANQTSSAFRLDLNNALQALASLSSGATAPATTYANMLWYDTANNLLKMRTEADYDPVDGWITIAYLDQGAGAFRILDDTQVVNTSGTQTGLIGDQATATWEAGTGTTPSLVSPASVKAAIRSLEPSIGVNQQWYNLTGSRSANTVYQNTTGRPIMVNIDGTATQSRIDVSTDNVNWVTATAMGNTPMSAIIPNNQYYRYYNDNNNVEFWSELR